MLVTWLESFGVMATLKYIPKSSVKSGQEDGEIRKYCGRLSSLGRLAYCQPP